MSIAVAVQKDNQIILATDSLVSFGSGCVPTENYTSNKMLTIGDSHLAATGWALYDNMMLDYLSGLETAPTLHSEAQIYRFFLDFWRKAKEDYSLVNEQCDDKNSPFADLDAYFLLTNHTGIYSIASNMNVLKFSQYYAVGSGADYSMGALHAIYESDLSAEQLVKKAVASAIALDTSCGGTIKCRANTINQRGNSVKNWIKRIAGLVQVGGGFMGIVHSLKTLLYSNTSTTTFILVTVFLIAYVFVLVAGVLLLEGNSRARRWSLWAQGLQIPFFLAPFFGYKFVAGLDISLYWIGNRGGLHYYFGSTWKLLLHGSSTWGVGVNLFALVLFICLWRFS